MNVPLSFKFDTEALSELITWYTDIQGDDRIIVVIGSQKIDNMLRELLAKSMGIEYDDTIFGFTSALGTFSARTMFARKLSLISDDFASLLTIIRRLRNDVAHSPELIDLAEPPVLDRINAIRRIVTVSPLWDILSVRIDPNHSLSNFLRLALVITTLNLSAATQLARPLRPLKECNVKLVGQGNPTKDDVH